MVREKRDGFSADEVTNGVVYRRGLMSRLEVDVIGRAIGIRGLGRVVHHED